EGHPRGQGQERPHRRRKIARLLRAGTFPVAYAYPQGMRETRDLVRRRTYLVRKRAELMTHLQILNSQYNLAPFPTKRAFAADRAERDIAQRFAGPSVRKSAAADVALIDALDVQSGPGPRRAGERRVSRPGQH